MKKTILLTIITLSAILAGFYFFKPPPVQKDFEGSFGKNSPNFRNAETKSISPYAEFGDSSVVLTTQQERTGTWEIENPNPKDKVQKMVFYSKTGILKLFGKKGIYLGQTTLPPESFARFLRPDRYAEKYYGLSPYQYAANNPVNNIDINGDSIQVNAGGMSYNYGFTQSGGYGFYDNQGNIYSGNDKFVGQVSSALAKLGLGKEGRGLIDFLSSSTNTVSMLSSNKNSADANGTYVNFNPSSTSVIPTAKGGATPPSYMSLGHEMAHIEDKYKGTLDQSTWVSITDANGNTQSIPRAEIYSTHRENQMRSEQGLPLRTHYAVDGSGNGYEPTRIIMKATHTSVYSQPIQVGSFQIPSFGGTTVTRPIIVPQRVSY